MKRRLAIACILCLLHTGLLMSQQTPDQKTELAKPFEWNLSWYSQKVNPPIAGDTLGPFEILKIEAQPATDSSPAVLRCLLAGYRTGIFPLATSYPAGLDPEGLREIEIIPPDPDAIQNYAPPKEIIQYYPEEETFPYYSLIGALLLLALLLVWWWYRRRKRKPGLVMPVKGTDPLKLLESVKSKWLEDLIGPEKLGEGMMQCSYAFLKTEREVTTRRLAQLLQVKSPETDRDALRKILEDIDAWRFGKQVPDKQTGIDALHYLGSIFINKRPSDNHA